MNELLARYRRARSWILDEAFPLWWSVGRDDAVGGFHERIRLDGSPTREIRRVRVSARQVYSYVVAGRLGWSGPWREAAEHGLRFILGKGLRGDGLLTHLIDADGAIVDAGPDLYDQAFLLLALAAAYSIDPQRALRDAALHVLASIKEKFGHPAIGFEETTVRRLPLRANPHMHLLEAAMGWIAAADDEVWRNLAGDVVGLCRSHFIDPRSGALLEHFDGDWRPHEGAIGRIVEPGHMFEWAWLLWRWGELSGEDVDSIAERFASLANGAGVDPARQVAVDEIDTGFRMVRGTARLWPQTERLKASLIRARMRVGPARRQSMAVAGEAFDSLFRYLAVGLPGAWRDVMRLDGSFAEEPAPASTLYHLACAILELGQFVEADHGADRAGHLGPAD